MTGPRDFVGQAAVAPQDRKVYLEVWRDRRLQVLHLPAVEGIVDDGQVAKARTALEHARTALTAVQDEQGAKVNAAEAKAVLLREEYQRKLSVAEANLAAARSQGASAPPAAAARPTGLGLKLRNLTDADRTKHGVTTGGAYVVAVKPGGLGAGAGVQADDVVVTFRGVVIVDARELADEAKHAPVDRRIYIEVLRSGRKELLVTGASGEAPPAATSTAEPAEAPPARADNRHLLPSRTETADNAGAAAIATVPPSRAIKAKYTTTHDYQHVFKDLTEFLAWQSANGNAGSIYNRTAFDFFDAADGGRVRFAGETRKCYVFDDRAAFDRYAVGAAQNYYNVKCHADGAVAAF